MLEKLIIENIALIEKLELDLGGGFTVLTGETGAGKSIIIDSVDLVLGGRANKELIAYGKQKAKAEAFFDVSGMPQVLNKLAELDITPEDGTLVISRDINLQGKSVARICGEVVQLSALKQITSLLVDVHGQHEHQSLLDENLHLDVIDAYMSESITPLKVEVSRLYGEYSGLCSKLNSGFISETERERRIDILKYQINEIESARLAENEEQAINDELKLLTNAERISNSINTCISALNAEGGVEAVKKAADALGSIAEYSAEFDSAAKRLSDLYYELEDAAYSVRSLRFDEEFDPRRIDALEQRLDIIDGLKHKYGRNIKEVLGFLAEAKAELDNLNGSAEQRELLIKKRDAVKQEFFKKAAQLTDARKRSADILCKKAEEELAALGMKGARLGTEFGTIDGEPHENGVDTARLLLSANKGEPLKALSKVASGGELSRIMLALKTVITGADGIPTLIFDEVDTGISGNTANIVGLRIKRIASAHQVLCVTHLPQIAAFADEHYLVEKGVSGERTYTTVKQLDLEGRINELARIMGAEESSEGAKSHAAELIKKARLES